MQPSIYFTTNERIKYCNQSGANDVNVVYNELHSLFYYTWFVIRIFVGEEKKHCF